MLFAEGSIGDNVGWISLALSVVTGVFAYLNNRAKLEFDKAKLSFDAEMTTLKQRVDDCENNTEIGRKALFTRIRVLEEKLDMKIKTFILEQSIVKYPEAEQPKSELGPLE